MADAVSVEEHSQLAERVKAIEERLGRHGPTLLEHGHQLDRHERQLADLRAANVETQKELRALSVQVGRLSDIATTQGLALERIERNVVRLVEILEARTVIVEGNHG